MQSNVTKQNKLVIGDYKIIRKLGEGAFGTVFQAKHNLTQNLVAIKMVAVRTSRQSFAVEREICLLQTLEHDETNHVIKLIEVLRLAPSESPIMLTSFPGPVSAEIRSIVCLVMEYFEGQEMLGYILKESRLSEETAAKLFRQLLLALQSVHQKGIVHRDLKLENILVNSNLELKLIDFGLGQAVDADSKLMNCVGSAVYCAPEVFERTGYCGFKADVWSCGVILYSMVSGEFPWEHPDTPEQIQEMASGAWPAALASPLCIEFIDSMMQLEPENRLAISELLAHPWMQKHAEHAQPKESTKTREIVEAINHQTATVSIQA